MTSTPRILAFAALCLSGTREVHAAAPLASGAVPAVVSAHGAAMLGHLDAAAPMHLSVSLPMRNAAGLTALLRALYTPGSPYYHRFLSVADYTARFGPTAPDYAAAAGFFAAHGLQVRADAANRALLQVSGPAGAIERVFHVTLNAYRHPTEPRAFFAPDREPTLDLAVPVQQVIGLDDYERPAPRLLRPDAAARMARITGCAGCWPASSGSYQAQEKAVSP